MSNQVQTKEELGLVAKRMTAAFADGTVEARLKAAVEGRGMLFAPQLLVEVEKIQAALLAVWGYASDHALAALHNAVKTYPELRPLIVNLCDAEEAMLATFQATLAKANGIDMQHQQHVQRTAPPGTVITHQIIMQMAQKSLPTENSAFMQQMQQKVLSGQQWTSDEKLKAMQVQQTMMKTVQSLSMIVPKAVEALTEEEHATLIAIEANMMKGQPPGPVERQALEGIQQSIATYCATMGPMIARMQAQQQAQQQLRSEPTSVPSGSADSNTDDSKKRD